MPFHAPPPRSRILTSVLLLLFAVGAVPLVLFGARLAGFNRERLEVQQKEHQLVLVESIAREISELVSGKVLEVQGIALAIETTLDAATPAELLGTVRQRGLLNRHLAQDPELARLLLAIRAPAGAGTEAGASQLDFVSTGRADETGRYAAAEELLVGTLLERGFGGEQRAESPATGAPVLVMVAPIRSGATVAAVLAAVVDLGELGERIETRSQQLYSVFLTDPQGRRLLARSRPRPDEPDLLASDLVAAFRSAGGTRTMQFRSVADGRSYDLLGAFATVPETGWGVFVQADVASAYYLVYKMERETVLWALLLVVLTSVVGTIFARRLVHPIRQLAEGALRLARGDFSQPLGLKSRNEIGLLAGTFNHMADEIRRQLGDLEHAASENKELFVSSIRMLAEAIDEKDPYTRGHSERVTRYAVATARALGMPEPEVEKIQMGALLHDVGKIGIDDRILRKPAVLTDEEFEIMKQHPDKGAHIMGAVRQLADIVPAMRFHHEKVDGSGYPLGLKGDEIPLAAQIVSVADTFDAMTTDRPYQRGMDPEFVVGKLKSWVGTRFRGDVVEAFEKAFRTGEILVKRRGPVPSPGPATRVS